MKKILGLWILSCVTTLLFPANSPPSRLLNGINRIDFRQWVPEKIDTVLATNLQYVRKGYAEKERVWWSIEGLTPSSYPSSIIPYTPEEGYPDFDPSKAQEFSSQVFQRLEGLLRTTMTKWNQAGL